MKESWSNGRVKTKIHKEMPKSIDRLAQYHIYHIGQSPRYAFSVSKERARFVIGFNVRGGSEAVSAPTAAGSPPLKLDIAVLQ